jgi:hypothetical protein
MTLEDIEKEYEQKTGLSALYGDDYNVVCHTESFVEWFVARFDLEHQRRVAAEKLIQKIIDINKRLNLYDVESQDSEYFMNWQSKVKQMEEGK